MAIVIEPGCFFSQTCKLVAWPFKTKSVEGSVRLMEADLSVIFVNHNLSMFYN